MRTVSKNTVTAVCAAADIQDFDYVAMILNAYVNLTEATPALPVVSEATVEAAERARTGFAWAAEKVEALHEYASKRVNDRSVVKSLGGIAEQLRVSEVAAENHRATLHAALGTTDGGRA